MEPNYEVAEIQAARVLHLNYLDFIISSSLTAESRSQRSTVIQPHHPQAPATSAKALVKIQPAISKTVSIEAKAVREPAKVELKTLTAIPKATGQVKEATTPGLQIERVPRKHSLHAADKSKAQPPPTSTRVLASSSVSQPLQAMPGVEQKQDQLFFVPLMEICELEHSTA